MDTLKASPEAYLQLTVDELAASVLPRDTMSQSSLELVIKHSLVFTNVPGPGESIFMMGQKITDIQTPIANIIPQMSMLSSDGFVHFTMVVYVSHDRSSCDVHLNSHLFHECFVFYSTGILICLFSLQSWSTFLSMNWNAWRMLFKSNETFQLARFSSDCGVFTIVSIIVHFL